MNIATRGSAPVARSTWLGVDEDVDPEGAVQAVVRRFLSAHGPTDRMDLRDRSRRRKDGWDLALRGPTVADPG